MSKINDYNEKCLDEIFTEMDEQIEKRQMDYDILLCTLCHIHDLTNADKDFSDKICEIRHICDTVLKDTRNV